MTIEQVLVLVGHATGLAWPALALATILLLRDDLRGLLRRNQVTLRFAEVELTARQAEEVLAETAERMARDAAGGAVSAAGAGAAEAVEFPQARVGAILWVDDNPANNLVEIAALENLGIRVRCEVSTRTGLRALDRSRFDAIVTDLGRLEDRRFVCEAGRDFIAALRDTDPTTPVAVYTSAKGSSQIEALTAVGADLVTAWPSVLLSFLAAPRRNLGEGSH